MWAVTGKLSAKDLLCGSHLGHWLRSSGWLQPPAQGLNATGAQDCTSAALGHHGPSWAMHGAWECDPVARDMLVWG